MFEVHRVGDGSRCGAPETKMVTAVVPARPRCSGPRHCATDCSYFQRPTRKQLSLDGICQHTNASYSQDLTTKLITMDMAALVCRIAFLAILNIPGLWINKVAALPLDLNTTIIDIPPSTQGNNAFERSGSAVVFKGCSDRQGQKLASFLSDIPTLAFTAAAKSTTPLSFRYFGSYANWYDDYVQSRFPFPL